MEYLSENLLCDEMHPSVLRSEVNLALQPRRLTYDDAPRPRRSHAWPWTLTVVGRTSHWGSHLTVGTARRALASRLGTVAQVDGMQKQWVNNKKIRESSESEAWGQLSSNRTGRTQTINPGNWRMNGWISETVEGISCLLYIVCWLGRVDQSSNMSEYLTS